MATNEVHVGDIGTIIQTTLQDDGVVVDISGASAKRYLVLKPDGTTTTWTAVFVGDGTDGQIKYAAVSGVIDQSGVWYVQAQIDWGTGEKLTAQKQSLLVHPKLI